MAKPGTMSSSQLAQTDSRRFDRSVSASKKRAIGGM
jgi:hypothetical protein